MIRKTPTILSLIGLLLSARFQESEIQVVTISGIDQETGEALRVIVGRPTPLPAGFTYSASDPLEGVTLKWFDPRRFEINVWADRYETQRLELDYSSPRKIKVAFRSVYRELPLEGQLWFALHAGVFSPEGVLAKRRRIEELRRKLGLCVKCGYDLRGSSERCPECGQEFEKQ